MIDTEVFAFNTVFQSVQRVFPLRGDEYEIRDVSAAYFRAMRRYPLRAVQDGAEAWILKGKRFPKPAEWIESIPRQKPAVELTALSEDEARAYLRAEAMRYEDAPCSCEACSTAGVTDKPLRFVPDVNGVKALIGERDVTVGRWAHGAELARWYAAKNKFWSDMFALFGVTEPTKQKRIKTTYEQRMAEIFNEPKRDRKPSDLELIS